MSPQIVCLLSLILFAFLRPASSTAQPLRYTTSKRCPLSNAATEDPTSLVNRAIAELLQKGALESTLACLLEALPRLRATSHPEIAAVEANIAIVSEALAPLVPGARRIIHGLDQNPVEWPPLTTTLRKPKRDSAIHISDGLLTAVQCKSIIDLFESSELYEGNVLQAGRIIVDRRGKSRWEFDVSHTHNNSDWMEWDRIFVGVVVSALSSYEDANPMLRTLKSPFGDEGFRAIRYNADAPTVEHHTWHADGGQEPRGAQPRILAAIIYLNEPEEGGETRFLNQGFEVKPKCGRVLIFPAAFPYVHGGAPVTEGSKYAVVLQITQ